jgi:BioD-like phosphotransacetylase family protein
LVSLYLVSAEEGAGKTAIAAGIARRLTGEGRKVAFLKPVFGDKMPEGGERDARFMSRLLGLEPAEALSPLVGSGKGAVDKIKACVSQDKDVTIIEGRCGQSPNDELSQTAYEVARALKAKVVAVEGYKLGASLQFVESYKGFGENLLGVILNKVPQSRLQRVCQEVTSSFSVEELAILGVLPEDRALLALAVGELAGHIQGEILNHAEKSAELV